jgi:hypothetical protein
MADFFLQIFKIHWLEWIFLWIFLAVLNLFHQCFIFNFYKYSPEYDTPFQSAGVADSTVLYQL